MAVAPGTRLGPHEIVSRIGAGGMGEVWKARDTRLDRSVAVKVLPADVARDAERRLRLGAQVADGLDRAHRAGVVHRDLKPGNLMLTRSGARLLDFGLARPRATTTGDVGDDQATATNTLTQTGALLGTVAYMAPEQLEGREADARSDLFALGAVLYEMVTGERAFPGTTQASVIAAILKSEPAPISRRQPLTPRPLERLIARCLVKDPEERWQSSHDVAEQLRGIDEDGRGDAPATRDGARGARRWKVSTAAMAAAALVVVVAASAAVWLRRSRHGAGQPGAAPVPRLVRLTWDMRSGGASLSPDGNSLAYGRIPAEGTDEKTDILVRRVGGENPVNVTKGSGAGNSSPAYSPDGQSLAFRSERDGGGIFLMDATGESVRRLTSSGVNPAWSPDGKTIACSSLLSEGWASDPISSLQVVDIATGSTRKVLEGNAVRPFWSPGGTRIAFDGRRQGMAGGRALFTVAATGGAPTLVASTPGIGWMSGVWTPGWIWFTNPEKGPPGIWRVRVDEATGKALGAPEPVLRSTTEIGSALSATPTGSRLLFTAFQREVLLLRWDVDPATGRVAPGLRTILAGGRPVYGTKPSPAGTWIAARLIDQSTEFREDLLLVNESTGEIRRLTDDAARESSFDWSPDGSWLYFCVALEGGSELWRVRPDGSGRERVLGTGPVGEVLAVVVSPDGRSLYVEGGRSHAPYLLAVLGTGAKGPPVALPSMPDGRVFGAIHWSPDGRWLAGLSRHPDGADDPALVVFDVRERVYRTFASVKVEDGAWWLPDSRRLLLPRGSGEAMVIDRESGSLTNAGSIGPGALNFWLSRDGRALCANTRGRPMQDVWMLDFGGKP